MASKQQFKICVSTCPHYVMVGDTHDLCVDCLGVFAIWNAPYTPGSLRGGSPGIRLSGFGSRICQGSTAAQIMEVSNGIGRGAFSALTCRFQCLHSGHGITVCGFFYVEWGSGVSNIQLWYIVSIEAGEFEDSTSISPAYEELLEVVTCVVILELWLASQETGSSLQEQVRQVLPVKQIPTSKSKLSFLFGSPHWGVEILGWAIFCLCLWSLAFELFFNCGTQWTWVWANVVEGIPGRPNEGKQMACAIGISIGAIVATESHLWLNLSGIR